MKVNIPKDLQDELNEVVKSYYKRQKKAKKSKLDRNKYKKEKKSHILQAINSVGKKSNKKQKRKKTNKLDFAIEQRSYTYTNVNGNEKKSSKEVVGDRNKIKITTVNTDGKKNVVVVPTPQHLIPISKPPSHHQTLTGFDFNENKRLRLPFKNDNMLLSLKPMMAKSLLNPQFL